MVNKERGTDNVEAVVKKRKRSGICGDRAYLTGRQVRRRSVGKCDAKLNAIPRQDLRRTQGGLAATRANIKDGQFSG